MLVDLTPFGLTGKSIEKLLDAAHITANKNTIPNDPQKPFVTSGIRLGTPAATSRGIKDGDWLIDSSGNFCSSRAIVQIKGNSQFLDPGSV